MKSVKNKISLTDYASEFAQINMKVKKKEIEHEEEQNIKIFKEENEIDKYEGVISETFNKRMVKYNKINIKMNLLKYNE